MKKIILDKQESVVLVTRIATCDFCSECSKPCVCNTKGVDICEDCIRQLEKKI